MQVSFDFPETVICFARPFRFSCSFWCMVGLYWRWLFCVVDLTGFGVNSALPSIDGAQFQVWSSIMSTFFSSWSLAKGIVACSYSLFVNFCLHAFLNCCVHVWVGVITYHQLGEFFFLERWKLGNSCVQGAGGNGFVILAPGILKRFWFVLFLLIKGNYFWLLQKASRNSTCYCLFLF